jgi:ssDNA-binding Zn-finger/Zn-ribbon topoisomerase 1
MPTCAKCGRTEATAEMRRRRPPYTGEWMCKDTPVCRERQKQKDDEGRDLLRPIRAVLRPQIAKHGDRFLSLMPPRLVMHCVLSTDTVYNVTLPKLSQAAE